MKKLLYFMEQYIYWNENKNINQQNKTFESLNRFEYTLKSIDKYTFESTKKKNLI